MPCWVVPSVAAEIWGISVDQILTGIEAGELEIRRENGWVFVDVAPGGPEVVPIKRLLPSERPRTYTVVTDEEVEALTVEDADVDARSEEEMHPDPEPEVSTFGNWRKARQRAARMRLAPPKFVAA